MSIVTEFAERKGRVSDATLGVVAGVLAIAFVVSDVVSIAVLGLTPRAGAPAAEILRFYEDGHARMVWYAFSHGIALSVLLAFGGSVSAYFIRRDERQRAAVHVFFGAVLSVVAVELVLRCATFAALGARADDLRPDAIIAIHSLATFAGVVISFVVVPGWIAFAVLARRAALARWMAPSAIVLAVLWLISSLMVVTESDAIFIASRAAFPGLGLFLVGLGISLIREGDGNNQEL